MRLEPVAVVVIMLVLVLVVAGCGGGKKKSAASATTAAGSTTTSAASTTVAAPSFNSTKNCAQLAALGAKMSQALQASSGNGLNSLGDEANVFTAAAKSFSAPKLQAAEQHLVAWSKKNCGIGSTTTG